MKIDSQIHIQDVRVECQRDFSMFAHMYRMSVRFTYYSNYHGVSVPKEVCATRLLNEEAFLDLGVKKAEALVYNDLMQMCTNEMVKLKEEIDGQLQKLHTQEPLRSVRSDEEEAGKLGDYRSEILGSLSEAYSFVNDPVLRRSYKSNGTTGDSGIDARRHDRWSGFGTG